MYVKLFAKILDSSIWLESDSTVRVWITLLASMDSEGMCHFAAIENLARRARVYPYLAKKAVAILEAPDLKSSGDGNAGRRIEKVQGGWVVLNAKKYREIRRSGDLRKPSKPRQLPTTPDNSRQLPSPIQLTTNGINKFLPEVEVDVEEEKRAKPKTRSTPLREDFQPNKTHAQLALALGVNLPTTVVAFKDFHLSKGNVFKDWDAALRTWIRNERKFSRDPQPQKSPMKNPAEEMRRQLEAD